MWWPENIKGRWALQIKHNLDTLTRQGDIKLHKESISKLHTNLFMNTNDKILNKILVMESISDVKEYYILAKQDYFQEFKDDSKWKKKGLFNIFYKL